MKHANVLVKQHNFKEFVILVKLIGVHFVQVKIFVKKILVMKHLSILMGNVCVLMDLSDFKEFVTAVILITVNNVNKMVFALNAPIPL